MMYTLEKNIEAGDLAYPEFDAAYKDIDPPFITVKVLISYKYEEEDRSTGYSERMSFVSWKFANPKDDDPLTRDAIEDYLYKHEEDFSDEALKEYNDDLEYDEEREY